MNHPFQRKSSKKTTGGTPFQRELVSCLEGYTAGPKRMSGRQLSLLLGKSANHISQMLNDGLVPSGQTILEMAQVLKLDRTGTDRLIRSAMETKAHQRSRDNFWINETNRMLRQSDEELARFQAFVQEKDIADQWRRFQAENPVRPVAASDDAPEAEADTQA